MTLLTAILLALSEIESGNNDNAIGSRGERGRYQIMEVTWKWHSNVPFRESAKNEAESKRTAEKILVQNSNEFFEWTGRQPTIREVYVMWNMGRHGYRKIGRDYSRVPASVKERCERFSNLVESFMKETLK